MQTGARAILFDRPVESRPIKDIPFFQGPPFGGPRVPRREIVESNGLISFLRQELAGVRADVTRSSRNQNVFRDNVIHSNSRNQGNDAVPALIGPGYFSLNKYNRSVHRVDESRCESIDLREVTNYTRRISRSYTPRRDILGDDAACANYGMAADADAGKDDYF